MGADFEGGFYGRSYGFTGIPNSGPIPGGRGAVGSTLDTVDHPGIRSQIQYRYGFEPSFLNHLCPGLR